MKHNDIAGAIFDFAGFLTTRPISTTFGACHDVATMPALIQEWAALRKLGTGAPNTEDWNKEEAK